MNVNSSAAQENSVSALLLRLQQRELLIPKAMVADVLSWNRDLFVAAASSESSWRLGKYQWKDEEIPLVCFEKLIQTTSASEELLKRKVVVLKSSQTEYASQHYAIHCRGFPKPLILSEQSLDFLDTDSHQEWIAHSISIGSRVLDIPDFDALEGAVWFTHPAVHQSA